ncbi:glycan-binding surface protein [uncultured Bacteroides sp.]|uniref:glycan-binding surface protein n=1 Tax=uncultured Bacteroides sp. TaxID=162156 RepID=UPI0026361174|nr:glycan-binding surface protein [uncultured Bacteroides sp.]
MIYVNHFVLFFSALLAILGTSCVNEIEEGMAPEAGAGEGYYISLTGDVNEGGVESRAYWDINNNDDTQSLAFTWESTDKMQSFVWRGGAFVDFTGDKKYSATTVTPDAENKKQAQLQITTGLSQQYAQDDVIWAVSPLAETDIDADNKVTFTLPDGFTQTVLNSTEHLKDYVLMSGTGTVGRNNSANISFNVLPAIYRFKVTNKDESETLTVNEVSISGPFCNKAELSMGNDGTVTPTYSVSNGTYAIKVTTPDGGLTVAANTTAYLYALVFPTETSKITDNITLSFKGKYGDTPVEDYKKAAKCSDIYKYDLDSNTYYDMEVPVNKTAGGDTEKSVITLFEGKSVISGWNNLVISNFYVHNLKEGDVLTVRFQDCESGTKSFKDNGTWQPLGDGAEGQIDLNEKTQGFFTYTITSESAEKLKKQNLILTGDGYTITKITLTTLLECDPVSVDAIMLSDFEGHTADNDKSWTEGVTLEYPIENGNTYLRFTYSSVPSSNDIWLFNCSHSSANVSNIENYVIKFDLKIEEGVTGASQAVMQYLLADDYWLWFGTNFFPETTDGKWITVSRNISDISTKLTGELSFVKDKGQGNKNNGMYGQNIPAGICIDNFRLEPKN